MKNTMNPIELFIAKKVKAMYDYYKDYESDLEMFLEQVTTSNEDFVGLLRHNEELLETKNELLQNAIIASIDVAKVRQVCVNAIYPPPLE